MRCANCDREECTREAKVREACERAPFRDGAMFVARDETARIAREDCAAHTVDWHARCLLAEARADEAGHLLGQVCVIATIDTRAGESVKVEPDHSATGAMWDMVKQRDVAHARVERLAGFLKRAASQLEIMHGELYGAVDISEAVTVIAECRAELEGK